MISSSNANIFKGLEFSANVISISVSAQHPAYREWRDENLSGVYNMVETVNNRPVYKVISS